MKSCAYCGRENTDSALQCLECGTDEFKNPGTMIPCASSSFFPGSRKSARAALAAQPWPEAWEKWLMQNFALYRLLGPEERSKLRVIARVLIAEKIWEGCGGLKISDIIQITIAAQAALLLLGLRHDYFDSILNIVVFAHEIELPREEWMDPRQPGRIVAGLAAKGTVYLSWSLTIAEARDVSIGHNLIIHEFAHELDFLDDHTNGTPNLTNRALARCWNQVMSAAYLDHQKAVREQRKTFLGDYAASNHAEFFAVLSEKFFLLPAGLQKAYPEIFEIFTAYYGQNPLKWFAHGYPTSH
ncbi:MAG TPA: zinc-dependent peptidase [Verrucomicrobiae bacterium]